MGDAASTAERYDVVVVGGGLVGGSVAVGLARAGRRVALVEPAPPAPGAATWDERCIAINQASYRILRDLGVWPELSRLAAPILSTHISEQGRFGVARFAAADAGLDALGYNVPIRRIGEVLWQAAAHEAGCDTLAPARLAGISVHDSHVDLRLQDERCIEARLVVAADGMQSPLRTWLGIDAQTRDYAQSALVTAVRTSRPHRGCAYERFTTGGPIAVLPKPWEADENLCSLVWTTPAEDVERRLQIDDAAFIALAQAAFGERLGRFVELGRRQAWPLSRVMSAQLTAPRVAFAGNAAQSLHPVAAQGFNLGLRDAATLTELLAAQAGDPGAPELLARYAALRAPDRQRTADFTDRLVRLFSNRVPGLRSLRHLGLLALDLAPPLREAVMWQNLGFGGYTPAVARQER